MLKKMKKAFTITELVIVIAVIAILAAVLIPTFTTVVNNANESAAMQETKSEWTTCSAEIVTTKNPSEMNYLIVRDGYAFVVANGNFEVEPVTVETGDDKTISATDTFVYKENTYTLEEAITQIIDSKGQELYKFNEGFTVYPFTVNPGSQGE